jgi:hypothetical protein
MDSTQHLEEVKIVYFEHEEQTLKFKLEEKLKTVMREKPIFKSEQISNPVTQANTGESLIKTTKPNQEYLKEKEDTKHILNLTQYNQYRNSRKIFQIKKYEKYNKYLEELCCDEDLSESDRKLFDDHKNKKNPYFSKIKFSKLKSEEKDERLKNLAKLVKRLRRKVRNLEHKVRFNATKLLNKHIWNRLGISTKNKYLQPEFTLDFDKICIALKRVRNYDGFEYTDQKHLLENLVNCIAEDKLKINSLMYRKICSVVRMLLKKEKIKYISKTESIVTISFPEQEVAISNLEYRSLIPYKDELRALRAILCAYDNEIKNDIEEKASEAKMEQDKNEIIRKENKIVTPFIEKISQFIQENENNMDGSCRKDINLDKNTPYKQDNKILNGFPTSNLFSQSTDNNSIDPFINKNINQSIYNVNTNPYVNNLNSISNQDENMNNMKMWLFSNRNIPQVQNLLLNIFSSSPIINNVTNNNLMNNPNYNLFNCIPSIPNYTMMSENIGGFSHIFNNLKSQLTNFVDPNTWFNNNANTFPIIKQQTQNNSKINNNMFLK